MKILVIGSTLGNLSLINEYVYQTGCDIVLCTGDVGIFPRGAHFPKSFYVGRFEEYINQYRDFICPVYAIRGPHDNLSICKKLWNKEIKVYNFTLLKDGESVSIKNNTKDDIPVRDIVIGGIGGSYSPKYYDNIEITRCFNKNNVESLKNKLHILLLYDVIGNISKKKILFSDEFYSLLDITSPFYCIIGKYNWWSSSKIPGTNIVVLPSANRGYLLIDTHDEWNSKVTSYETIQ